MNEEPPYLGFIPRKQYYTIDKNNQWVECTPPAEIERIIKGVKK